MCKPPGFLLLLNTALVSHQQAWFLFFSFAQKERPLIACFLIPPHWSGYIQISSGTSKQTGNVLLWKRAIILEGPVMRRPTFQHPRRPCRALYLGPYWGVGWAGVQRVILIFLHTRLKEGWIFMKSHQLCCLLCLAVPQQAVPLGGEASLQGL